MLLKFILVFLGGGLGSTFRFLFYQLVLKLSLSSFFSTIFVNVFGCFLISLGSSLLLKYFNNHYSYFSCFFVVGVLGGFTTFSSFIFDFFSLPNLSNFIYLVSTVLLSLLSFYLGTLVFKII